MQIDSDKMASRCIVTAIITTLAITSFYWGSWWVILSAWVLAFPLALLLGLISGFVSHGLGFTVEDQKVWTGEAEVVITEKSEAILGLFQENKIHEWVILKRPDNGELVKLFYWCTVDMSGNSVINTPENWFVILHPGIMYVEPENNQVSE